MSTHRLLWTMVVTVGVLAPAAAFAQQSGTTTQDKRPPMQLTALDYIEIQQLVARYALAIDTCLNNGYGYADLYTEDGYFAPKQDGRVGTKFQGRERLAQAAGGGPSGCKDKPADPLDARSHHLYANHVITPTADGAIGTVELLVAGRNGDRNIMEIQGYYEDVYKKTRNGWRFQSRTHVVPHDFRRTPPTQSQSQPPPSGSVPAQQAR